MTPSKYSQACIAHADLTWTFGEGWADLEEFHIKDKNQVHLRSHSVWMVWKVSEEILKNPPDYVTISFIQEMVTKYFSPDYIKKHGVGRYNHVMNKLCIIGLYDRLKRDGIVQYTIPPTIRDRGMLWFYSSNIYIAPNYGMLGWQFRDVGGKIGNK